MDSSIFSTVQGSSSNQFPEECGGRTTERMKGKGKDQDSDSVQRAPTLVLLPPSGHTTIHGIDLEEEERFYTDLLMNDNTEDGPPAVRGHTNIPLRRRSLSTLPRLSKLRPSQRVPTDTFSHPRSAFIPQHHDFTEVYEPFTPIRPRPPRAESIFSSEIYLVDNTIGGGNDSLRTSAPPLFAQAVKIDGWVVVGDGANPHQDVMLLPDDPSRGSVSQPSSPKKSTLGKSQVGSLKKVGSGSGAYVVYDIVITTREGTTMKIFRRYSSFEELWEGLMTSLATHLHAHILNLPPKAPFARFRPAFLEKRRQLLEFWLSRILLHPELGGRKVVRDWVLKY